MAKGEFFLLFFVKKVVIFQKNILSAKQRLGVFCRTGMKEARVVGSKKLKKGVGSVREK